MDKCQEAIVRETIVLLDNSMRCRCVAISNVPLRSKWYEVRMKGKKKSTVLHNYTMWTQHSAELDDRTRLVYLNGLISPQGRERVCSSVQYSCVYCATLGFRYSVQCNVGKRQSASNNFATRLCCSLATIRHVKDSRFCCTRCQDVRRSFYLFTFLFSFFVTCACFAKDRSAQTFIIC